MENLEALYKKFLEVPDHASEKVAILDHNINHTNLNGNGEIQSLKFFHQYYFWVEKTDKWKCNYTMAYYHHPKRQQPLYELFLDKCIKEVFGTL